MLCLGYKSCFFVYYYFFIPRATTTNPPCYVPIFSIFLKINFLGVCFFLRQHTHFDILYSHSFSLRTIPYHIYSPSLLPFIHSSLPSLPPSEEKTTPYVLYHILSPSISLLNFLPTLSLSLSPPALSSSFRRKNYSLRIIPYLISLYLYLSLTLSLL